MKLTKIEKEVTRTYLRDVEGHRFFKLYSTGEMSLFIKIEPVNTNTGFFIVQAVTERGLGTMSNLSGSTAVIPVDILEMRYKEGEL